MGEKDLTKILNRTTGLKWEKEGKTYRHKLYIVEDLSYKTLFFTIQKYRLSHIFAKGIIFSSFSDLLKEINTFVEIYK